MGSEWAVEKLSELTSKITKGTTPSKKDGGFVPSGINFIKAECVTLQGTIDDSKFAYVTDEVHKKYKRSHLEAGDILFSMAGVILGKTALVKNEHLPANTNQALSLIRPITEKILPRYLHYFLQQGSVFHFVNNSTSQSAQPNINLQEIGSLDVTVPPLPEQKAIAHILGVLDDKIELNRRMNETLEGMAQALFKSWFVDFDPVIDNILARNLARCPSPNLSHGEMDGSSPSGRSGDEGSILDGIPEEFAARAETRRKALADGTANREAAKAFPDSFQETEEMGWIPEGWKVKELPDVIDFLEGPGIRNWQYTDDEDGIKFINIRCIQNGDLKLDTASKLTREEAFGKYAHFQLKVDDIVVSTSGTLGRYAFIRKVHLPLSLNTSVIRFGKIDGVSTLHYVAGYIETTLQRELEMRATGSAQLNFGPMHLKQIKMLVPDIKILDAHNAVADHLFKKRQSNLESVDILTKLRDTLLPKLISGELRIEDAEKMVGALG